jgi:hypothetical protein
VQIHIFDPRGLLTKLLRYPLATILCATALVIGVLHVVLAIITVSTYAFNYPFMDEIRISLHYIQIPFPRSILQLENGHRLVLPGLLRSIEIKMFQGAPYLQSIASTTAIFSSYYILTRAVMREPEANMFLKLGTAALIASVLFWIAHARMLVHIFESCHILFITFFLVLAIKFAISASSTENSRWIFAALCCAGATFSFGPGIASFVALFAVALSRRASVKVLAIIVLSAGLCALLYAYGLPGGDGARHSVTGQIATSIFLLIARIGAIWVAIFDPYARGNEVSILTGCILGLVGFAVTGFAAITQWAKKQPLSEAGMYGIAFFVFGLTANALITISRQEYFAQYPDQLFAPRYLFWSSLTWLGIGLYSFSLQRDANRANAFLIVAILACACAIRPAFISTGWSATVYRNVELSAIAMYLGVRDDEIVGSVTDGNPLLTYEAAQVMKERQLGPFSFFSGIQIGETAAFAKQELTTAPLSIAIRRGREWRTQDNERFQVVSGSLPVAVAKSIGRNPIVLANEDGKITGVVTLNSTGKRPQTMLRENGTTLTEFGGYVQSGANPKWLGTRSSDGGLTLVVASVP